MTRRCLTHLAILSLLAGAAFADGRSPQKHTVESAAPVRAAVGEDGLIASPEPGWPQWRGARRDGVSDEKGLLPRWPDDGPKLLWRIDGLGQGWSSPIVVDDTLYITGEVGDELVAFAFDLQGAPRWRTVNGEAWNGPYPGARSTCTYSEGRVYLMNAYGRLVCLDSNTGNELWAVDVLDRFQARNIQWALSECLLVDGPRVIVTPGGEKGLIAALDKHTGSTLWSTPPLDDERTSHASPILFRYAGRRIISNCSAGYGFGVDADTGELLWAVPVKNQFGTNVSTPVYHAGSIFYVTPFTDLGRLFRLRPAQSGLSAEHVWTSPLDTVTGCAVLVGDTLYAAGYRRPKSWFAIDWETGETKHELEDFTTGAAIYADGRLYVLDEQANVGLIDPRPDGMQVVGQFRLVEDRVRDAWAHPVLLNGRLYLRYHDSLWCYHVAAE
ncbi:MAG: PQQ-binding-like beta-propeller repeat protein [Thermoguttaceae bacterium]|jgi:outer membrane protein assembly factor BamB|nr:PQQ-binding-like beta-propeller repeat protein [Thermoguttaceae bacterium]